MFDFQKGRIKLIRGGGYPHCHTVFIDDEIRVFIDAASREDTLKAIHKERPVNIIITSHGHEDHIMYNYLFPQASLWVPEADAPIFRGIKDFIGSFIDLYGLSEEDYILWEEFLSKECHYTPREPDRLLRDGDILKFGETTTEVIHTPGHTPGHCAFHFLEERVLYLADLDLVKAGPYYGDPSSDLDETIRSLNRVASIDVDTYLTAHGKGIYEGDPIHIHRYLDTIRDREEKLLGLLQKGPKTLDEITKEGIIYGNHKAIAQWDLSLSEKGMMKKHLERIERQARVTKEGDYYHIVR